MTIETDTRCTSRGRCALWCTCVGTFAIPCVCEGEDERAAHGDAKRDGAGLPAGVIDTFHSGFNHTTEQSNHG